jgi:hypothetical protein
MSVKQSIALFSELMIGCALLPAASFAQVSFESQQIAANPYGFNVTAHGDFNNDGREDLATFRRVDEDTSIFQLYLSNGDGSYQAPVTLPAGVGIIGDFNGDGNLDFVSGAAGSLAVHLGNGDGTFRSPRTVTDANYYVVAADMNHDGKTDLVVLNSSSTLQIWISKGDGTFSKGQTVSFTSKASNYLRLVTGDFDGDSNPDIAYVSPQNTTTVVDIWYGDGAGHLGPVYTATDPKKYYDEGAFVADINNDGRSDIIATPYQGDQGDTLPGLAIFSGNANRTLSYSTIATNNCVYGATVADFNGDGLNDLLFNDFDCSAVPYGYGTNVVARLGKGSGSFGPEQPVYQNQSGVTSFYAVRTSLGTRPDVAFSLASDTTIPDSTSSIDLLINTSDGAFPGCGPSGFAEGVTVCAPGGTASSPVKFSVGAAGPTPMRTAQVWADGKKVTEQLAHAFSNYSFLDASAPLAAGSHRISVLGTGWDGSIQTKTFTLTVSGSSSCSAPTSAGIHICAPASGASVSSPVAIQATATITGKLSSVQVWIDGVKKFSETTSTSLNTSLSVGTGSHRFAVLATNTSGQKWESAVNATVK